MTSNRPPDERLEGLSREQLLRLLRVVPAMTRASAEPDHSLAIDTLLQVAAEATDSDRASVYFVDAEKNLLVLVGAHPHDPTLAEKYSTLPLESRTGETIRTGRSATWTPEQAGPVAEVARSLGVRQVACVPLFVQGKATAAMVVTRDMDRRYDDAQLDFAQILGELVIVYIENARLYADARSHLDETRMLLDVGRRIHASIELEQRLDVSAEALRRSVDASKAFILLLEDDDTVLHCVAASSAELREEVRTVRIPMNAEGSVVVATVKTRRAIAIEDVRSSRNVNMELAERLDEKAVLALPLLVNDRPIGAVLIDESRGARRWTRAEIERAELIAQNVAIAVANARLYEEIRSRSSELERAQKELVKRERLAALGQLAATLAHEVRNPLGVLFNSIGTLGKMLPPEGDAATLLTIMSEESVRLERLVRELLDFARPLAPSLEPESLGVVIEGAVDAASRAVGDDAPRVTMDIAADLPPVRLDASMIRRAIVNLVVNAVQAAGSDGKVRVRASVDQRGARRFARIDVTDSGPGIAPELASRVFEPFFTTKATGTGLGLAVVKSIVDSHGGEIALDSPKGNGTTVSMLVPIDPESSEIRTGLVRAGW